MDRVDQLLHNTITSALDAWSGELRRYGIKCNTRITHLVDTQAFTCLLGRQAPSEEHDALVVFSVQNGLDYRVCERLPPLLSMRVGGVSSDGEACVQPEHARSCERRQIPVCVLRTLSKTASTKMRPNLTRSLGT